MTNPARAAVQYRALFEPCDAGQWSLPLEVLIARAVHARLLTAINNHPAAPPDPYEALVIAALTCDEPSKLDVTPLLDHQRVTAERDRRLQVLRTALDRSAQDLIDSVRDSAHTIIRDHLAPVLDQLWLEVVKAVKALGDRDPSDTTAMLSAPARVREAYLAMDGLAVRYNRLREAWARMPVGEPEYDTRGEHSEFEVGLYCVWPDGKRWAMAPPATPPWPVGDGGKGRLIWLVKADAKPWLPTPEQRDRAWQAANAEALERMKEQSRRHREAHGVWSQAG